jgi:hypothetical protein
MGVKTKKPALGTGFLQLELSDRVS